METQQPAADSIATVPSTLNQQAEQAPYLLDQKAAAMDVRLREG